MGTGQIRVVASLDLVPGSREEVERLAREAAATVAAEEPGTLAYDWYISADATTARAHEVYESAGDLLAHLGGRAATEVLQPLHPVLTGMAIEVFGEPSAEVVGATEGAPFAYFGEGVAAVGR